MLFATWVTALNILVFAALVAAVIYLFVLIVRALKKYIGSKEMREEKQAVYSHAEMEAMAEANAALGSWRLEDCDLYVTLEPCPMCAGAIINARVARVFYGARDEAMGACGGVLNLFMEAFPHRPQLVGGICAGESRALLAEFFAEMRRK